MGIRGKLVLRNLLDLSRIESGAYRLTKAPFHVRTCFTVYLPAYVSGGNSEMAIEDAENVEAIANSGR